jgi:hypothetical protein
LCSEIDSYLWHLKESLKCLQMAIYRIKVAFQ